MVIPVPAIGSVAAAISFSYVMLQRSVTPAISLVSYIILKVRPVIVSMFLSFKTRLKV